MRRHRRLWRHRLSGRLPQDQAEELPRRAGALQAPRQFLIGGSVISYAFLAREHVPDDWWDIRFNLAVPFVAFTKHPLVLPAWIYLPFAVTLVVWTSNAVNLTDGLDGLAIGPVMINAGTYLVWATLAGATFGIAHVAQRFVVAKYLDIPAIMSAGEAFSIYCGAMVGAGIGFLWYNTYSRVGLHGRRRFPWPSAAASGCALSSRRTSSSRPSSGGVFFLEAESVVIQVASFRPDVGDASSSWRPSTTILEKRGSGPEPKIIVRFLDHPPSFLLALLSLSELEAPLSP